MTPELEKFIALATRPLEDRPEQREEARGELMGRLSHQGVPVEMIDVAEPTARLEAAKRFPDNWRRGLVLGSLILMLGLFVFGLASDGSMFARAMYSNQMSWRMRSDDIVPTTRFDHFFYNWLDRKAPDLPVSGRPGEIEALRRTHPEDLAILQEALMHRSIKEDEFMTAGERDLITRLDPGNALWPMLEMSWEFHKAKGIDPFTSFYFGSSGRSDPDAEKRGWERFAEAVKMDRFRAYGGDLARRQAEAYGEDRTVMDGLLLSQIVRWPRSGSQNIRIYFGPRSGGFSQTMAERVRTLAGPGREDELLGLFEDWKKCLRLVIDAEHPDPWSLASYVENGAEAGNAFQSGFSRLGMKDAEDEARRIVAGFAPKPSLATLSRDEAGVRLQDGRWNSAPITPREMKPGRMADMAMFHRMLTWPLVLIALIYVLLCGFEACRRSPAVKGMARGLMPLLTVRDHLFIGISGIVVPWLYWWSITRLTPVGISDKVFSNDEWVALTWVLQIAIGMVLGMVMLTQAVQWRWAKVGGFLGLAGGVPWLGRLVAWLVAASLPAAGMIRFLPLTGDEEKAYFLLGCAGMGSLGLLWLLWVGIMNLCTPRHGALRPNLVARTLIPWSLAGFATLLLATGVLRFAEGWWYRRDPLLPGRTSEHYANALEERAVQRQAERLREALGPGS